MSKSIFLSRRLFPLAVAGGLLFALAPMAATSAAPPITTRTSISSTGEEGNASSVGGPVSADGRFVAFDSSAGNLVAGDNNGFKDVFLRDLKTGLTQQVSLGNAGNEGNGSSSVLAISNNGSFVTFLSEAGNLVPGDSNGVADVFIRDLKNTRTQRIFVNNADGQGGPTSSGFSVSASGRFVLFTYQSGNLVDGDTNGYQDVFVHDLKTGVTTRVSVNSAGEEASGAGFDPSSNCGGGSYLLDSDSASISADGRFVAFRSFACNLVEVDNNADFIYQGGDIFVHDLKTGETKIASVDNAGEQFTFNHEPVISANGRFVAFTSSYGGELNLLYYITSNIAVHDLKTGETKLTSIDSVAGDYSYFGSFGPRISNTGRFILFSSDSSNLVPEDTNGGAKWLRSL